MVVIYNQKVKILQKGLHAVLYQEIMQEKLRSLPCAGHGIVYIPLAAYVVYVCSVWPHRLLQGWQSDQSPSV